MGLFDKFKKRTEAKSDRYQTAVFTGERDLLDYPLTNLSYQGTSISIQENMLAKPDESLPHICEDFNAVLDEGVEKLIREKFIPWLNGDEKTEDDEKIFEGLKLYSIVYDYRKIVAKYSPTGEDGFFGLFEFSFEAGNEFVENILQAASLVVKVCNGKVVGTECFDI